MSLTHLPPVWSSLTGQRVTGQEVATTLHAVRLEGPNVTDGLYIGLFATGMQHSRLQHHPRLSTMSLGWGMRRSPPGEAVGARSAKMCETWPAQESYEVIETQGPCPPENPPQPRLTLSYSVQISTCCCLSGQVYAA